MSALLVADACNVGLTPVADPDYPPRSHDRLNWTAQNYVRSATHAAASTRLVDYHAHLDLARHAWGGGDMASADPMRFVIPVSTIHAGYNPRYFGRQRGSTLYTWMADTHPSFHQTLIPGTQRDSLYALDGLLANQTVVRPDTVSTDTAGASEIVFALAWTLGYRYAPRLADLADHRLWRIDTRRRLRAAPRPGPKPRQHLAHHRPMGPDLPPHRLPRGPDRHPLGDPALPPTGTQPLQPRTGTGRAGPDHQDPPRPQLLPRRRCTGGPSTASSAEARAATASPETSSTEDGASSASTTSAGQENQLGALGLMVNVIVLWQTVYIQAALDHLVANGHEPDPGDVARLSPLGHPTINLHGRYRTTGRAPSGGLRPLRRAR